jgi:hypothetical protein
MYLESGSHQLLEMLFFVTTDDSLVVAFCLFKFLTAHFNFLFLLQRGNPFLTFFRGLIEVFESLLCCLTFCLNQIACFTSALEQIGGFSKASLCTCDI